MTAAGALLDAFRPDAPVHGFVVVYLLAACGLGWSLGATDRLVPFSYSILWLTLLTLFVPTALVPAALARRLRSPARTCFVESLSSQSASFRAQILALLASGLSTSVFFGTFTSVKNMLPLIVRFTHDQRLADVDYRLHGEHAPWTLLQPVLGNPQVTGIMEILYAPVWFALLVSFPAMLLFQGASRHLCRRYLLALMLGFVILGNLLAAVGMSAGPVYYGGMTGDHERFAGLVQFLQAESGRPYAAWDLQQHLWECWRRGQVHLGTGISAFPSLHVAVATLFLLAARRVRPLFGRLMGLYLAMIMLGSVHLGWHYAIDGYVSILAMIPIWWLSGRLLELRHASVEPASRGIVPA